MNGERILLRSAHTAHHITTTAAETEDHLHYGADRGPTYWQRSIVGLSGAELSQSQSQIYGEAGHPTIRDICDPMRWNVPVDDGTATQSVSV